MTLLAACQSRNCVFVYALTLFLPSVLGAQKFTPASEKVFGIQGVVKDTSGNPLPATEISLNDDEVTISDAKGAFAFTGVPVGITQVTFRRIGYLPAVLAFEGPENVVISLAATMKPAGVQLGTIVIEGKRVDRELAETGFYQRERLMKGTFFGPERMARTVAPLSYTLMDAPRVWLRNGKPQMRVRGTDRFCGIHVFLDGVPMTGDIESPDSYINSSQVKAMEFYGDPRDAPVTVKTHFGNVFIRGKENGCGILLLWTK
jgi:hypothetical protein